MMNNMELNYLVSKERVNDLALAAERYRLAQEAASVDSRPRSRVARALLRFRGRDTRRATAKDSRAAGRAQRSSLDSTSPTYSSRS
jgi:hypothetical protein